MTAIQAYEKAGFKKLYEFELWRFLGFKIRIRKS